MPRSAKAINVDKNHITADFVTRKQGIETQKESIIVYLNTLDQSKLSKTSDLVHEPEIDAKQTMTDKQDPLNSPLFLAPYVSSSTPLPLLFPGHPRASLHTHRTTLSQTTGILNTNFHSELLFLGRVDMLTGEGREAEVKGEREQESWARRDSLLCQTFNAIHSPISEPGAVSPT